jgi:hypothetical protein
MERSFEAKLHYVRGLVSGMAKRLETESWQFLPEQLESVRYELTTMVEMWGAIRSKRESEADQCQSK